MSNQTPFAKAVANFLNHSMQSESKYADVFVAMLEMETTFDKGWAEKFLKTSGPDKTDMIESTFRRIELEGYEQLLEDSRIKLNKQTDASDRITKEQAQKKVHSLNMMLKTVAFAVAGFKLMGVEKYEKRANGRVAYQVGGGWVEHKRGESFNTLVATGKEKAKEAGWTETPKQTVHKAVSEGAASKGTSVAQTAEDLIKSGGMLPSGTAFSGMCKGLMIALRNKESMAKLSDSEVSALRDLENEVIHFVYADDNGVIDVDCLAEQYGDDTHKPSQAQAA